MNMQEIRAEAKAKFEARYLDGDEVQNGQILSSSECLEAIMDAITQFTKAEWRRCIKVLDHDHSKCALKQTCIGYGNAQSDLMNEPPLADGKTIDEAINVIE